MIFRETALKDAFVIELDKVEDDRGFFARTWCQKEFQEHGLVPRVVQTSISYNKKRGTLRGLHFQATPFAETKLVRCTKGAIHDVIIDLRTDSPTFKQWLGIDLTAENYKMLYVPEKFAHGFETLTDDTEVTYQASQFYTPSAERGIRWDDPLFRIAWPTEIRIASHKDATWPNYSP